MEEKEDFDIESELSSEPSDNSELSNKTQWSDDIQQQNYNDFKDNINDMFNINNKRYLNNENVNLPPLNRQSYVQHKFSNSQ
jgi:hypothetical protein